MAILLAENMTRFAVMAIKFYQRHASMKLRASCCYEPTCSEYAIASLYKYGFVRGLILTSKRIMRCRPPGGGIDEP